LSGAVDGALYRHENKRINSSIVIREEIDQAKMLDFSEDELKEVSRNAEFLYAHLTSQVRNHIFCKSIAAASVYVTGVNMGKKGVTQLRLSELYGISKVTIRSTVHKVWKWDANNFHLIIKNKFIEKN
jgi:hypothetical protein